VEYGDGQQMTNKKSLLQLIAIAGWFAISLACAGGLPETSPPETEKEPPEGVAASSTKLHAPAGWAASPLPFLIRATETQPSWQHFPAVKEIHDVTQIPKYWKDYKADGSCRWGGGSSGVFKEYRGKWSFRKTHFNVKYRVTVDIPTECGPESKEDDFCSRTEEGSPGDWTLSAARFIVFTTPAGEEKLRVVGCYSGKGALIVPEQPGCNWVISDGTSVEALEENYQDYFGARILLAGGDQIEMLRVIEGVSEVLLETVSSRPKHLQLGSLIDVDQAKNAREGVIEVLYGLQQKELGMNIIASLEKQGATVTHRVYEQTQAPVIIAVGSDSGIR